MMQLNKKRIICFRKYITLFFLVLLLALYTLNIIINTEYFNENVDQFAFLDLGFKISNGDWYLGNQHPLLPILLAPLSHDLSTYLFKAKMLVLSLGIISFIIIYLVALKRFGYIVASLGSVFLIPIIGELSVQVLCEVLLVLWFFLWWHYLIKALETNETKYFLSAGIFIGLAFFTKASGLLLLFVSIIIFFVYYRKQIVSKSKDLLILLLPLLVINFPLLIANMLVYGNPFYNKNSAHFMWIDRWDDIYQPGFILQGSLWRYLSSHTLYDIFERIIVGVFYTPFNILFVMFIIIAVILLALDYKRDKKKYHTHHILINRETWLISLVFISSYFIIISWYIYMMRGSQNQRFIYPVMPILIFLLVEIFLITIKHFIKINVKLKKKFFYIFSVTMIVLLLLFNIKMLLTLDYQGIIKVNLKQQETIKELVLSNYKEAYPVKLLTTGNWFIPRGEFWSNQIEVKDIEYNIKLDEFEDFIAENGISYIFINSMVFERREDILNNYIGFDAIDKLWQIKNVPKNWQLLVKAHEGCTDTYLIFKILKE
ncbi:glycosyltransferase family 39 protein [Patescibacteria group bacterium]|nr:glycosyltransferase family 39 protein [Patescibacteria group bacterium]